MIIATRFIVTGRVQGVFFRASTRREAERLGLRGSAVNLSDGSVEVVAVGEINAVGELAQWLEQGPSRARVDSLRSDSLAPEGFQTLSGFSCA